jgi:hypothetical protein
MRCSAAACIGDWAWAAGGCAVGAGAAAAAKGCVAAGCARLGNGAATSNSVAKRASIEVLTIMIDSREGCIG